MIDLEKLRDQLVPSEYSWQLRQNVPADWLVLGKGKYLFAAVPFQEIPEGDYGSRYVKRKVRIIASAWPVFAEKGLFLLYYGPAQSWQPHKEKFTVDKTGLRPVILQCVYFLDADNADHYHRCTQWGPIKFGFADGVIEILDKQFS